MRLFYFSLFLLPIFMLQFSCSVFDHETNLGRNLFDTLINFDGKEFKDSLNITGKFSFIDTQGNVKSGVKQFATKNIIGKWRNEQSFVYLELFKTKIADTTVTEKKDTLITTVNSRLKKYIDSTDTNLIELKSFLITLLLDTSISKVKNGSIIFGKCKKTRLAGADSIKNKIDTTTFIPFDTIAFNKDTIKITVPDTMFHRDTMFFDSIPFYISLLSSNDSSLVFFNITSIKEILFHKKTGIYDTTDTAIIKYYSKYNNCSIFEKNLLNIDTTLISSNCTDRFVQFELDLTNFWNNMKTIDGIAEYKNIPYANLTLYLDSVFRYPDTLKKVTFQYALSSSSHTSIKDIITPPNKGFLVADTISSNTINFKLNTFLLNMREYKKLSEVPQKVYLYIRVTDIYFAQVFWKRKFTNLPFTYVFSDKE